VANYSADELRAIVDFYQSAEGQAILRAKRAAAGTMRPPTYSAEQRAALAAFDATPLGRSIHAKRPKLIGASSLMVMSVEAEP
jgi:hypothetical protein